MDMSGETTSEVHRSVDIWDLLSHPLRRRLLVELPDHDNPVSLHALVDDLAGSGTTGSDESLDPDDVRAQLHHVHLPKLSTAGWVEYDAETAVVRYEQRTEAVRSDLRSAADELDRIRAAYE